MFSKNKKETPPCAPPPHHGVNQGGGDNMGFLMFTYVVRTQYKIKLPAVLSAFLTSPLHHIFSILPRCGI